MKVGIITITNGTNYGNRLQIYAVQQILKKLGHDSELIENNTWRHGKVYHLKRYLKILLNYHNESDEYKREKSFHEFDSKYIKVGAEGFDENYKNSKLGSRYDAFLCGSDQIWNPRYPYLNGGCFGDFPNAKKRIAYAVSFGEPYIPDVKKTDYKRWLTGMNAISVREKAGRGIVEELIDCTPEVLIDPTMMLNSNEWSEIAEKPKNVPERKYAFLYFLGEISPEVLEFVVKIKQEKGLHILNALPQTKEENYYLNPSHFIYLLSNAELVITDSFHASVFSILFGRHLRVFDRVSGKMNMGSRLDTLTDTFGCEWTRNNFSINYEEDQEFNSLTKLEVERKKALYFLQYALAEDDGK